MQDILIHDYIYIQSLLNVFDEAFSSITHPCFLLHLWHYRNSTLVSEFWSEMTDTTDADMQKYRNLRNIHNGEVHNSNNIGKRVETIVIFMRYKHFPKRIWERGEALFYSWQIRMSFLSGAPCTSQTSAEKINNVPITFVSNCLFDRFMSLFL